MILLLEHVWDVHDTKLLLSLIEDFWHLLTDNKTKKHLVCRRVSQRMNEAGYKITHVQCEGRWKTMKAVYKRCIDHNNETGKLLLITFVLMY